MYETKTQREPAQLKADFEQRIIEGYASTFNNVDLVGDVVVPGAFKKTLADRLPRKLVKVFYDHYVPIGMPVKAEEDGTGLFTVSKISQVPEGDKTLQFVADGLCAHMSFAYDVVKREYLEQTDPNSYPIRRLLELKLYEFGPVHFPANEQAEILSLKDLSEMLREAKARVPELSALLRKRGYLGDAELDLVRHLGTAISTAVAESIKALSEGQPELTVTQTDAATTPAGEPPTPQAEATDPESGLYVVAGQLNALKTMLDSAFAPRVGH